jgi:hypothetical protein
MKIFDFLRPLSKDFRVQLFKGKDGWQHRTVATNGNKIQTSESYSDKTDAAKTAKHLASEARFRYEEL